MAVEEKENSVITETDIICIAIVTTESAIGIEKHMRLGIISNSTAIRLMSNGCGMSLNSSNISTNVLFGISGTGYAFIQLDFKRVYPGVPIFKL